MRELGYVSNLLNNHYEEICSIFKKYNISQVRIFGSVARMEDKETSDLDLLVDMPVESTLIDQGNLQYEIQQLLGVTMDMITYGCLNPMVLEHFKQISVDFYAIQNLTSESAIKEQMTDTDRVQRNGKSVIWVIDRILECCKGVTKEEFLKDCMIQDAVTRNIQLLGQIMTQFPEEKWVGDRTLFLKAQKGCIVLRDALFMNVDYNLLWNTVTEELPQIREMFEKGLKQ